MDELVENGGENRRVGWCNETIGYGTEGLDSAGPFWSRVELIVPDYHFALTGWSDLYEDPDEPADNFFAREVHWKLSSRLVRTPMIWGSWASWRKYHAGRVSHAIATSEMALPRLRFELSKNYPVTLAMDVDSLQIYLESVLSAVGADPKNQKIEGRLIRFLHRCDPDAFPEPVRRVFEQHPEHRATLHRLLPAACQFSDDEFGLGMTVRELAAHLIVSRSTIRRVAQALGIKPVSRRRPFFYTTEDCESIKTQIASKRA